MPKKEITDYPVIRILPEQINNCYHVEWSDPDTPIHRVQIYHIFELIKKVAKETEGLKIEYVKANADGNEEINILPIEPITKLTVSDTHISSLRYRVQELEDEMQIVWAMFKKIGFQRDDSDTP